MSEARGFFLVLEGIDGSGTTTQAAMLQKWLQAAGRDAIVTCEPSTGPVGETLRSFLSANQTTTDGAMALLFAADRLDHLAREITPALEAGVHVICDRYVLSSLAYQGTTLDPVWVEAINSHARIPDLTVFLRTSVERATARRAMRGGDAEIFEVPHTQQAVAARYAALVDEGQAQWRWDTDRWLSSQTAARASQQPRSHLGPIAVVDGEATIDEIHRQLRILFTTVRP